ncbi:conserved hypothetical protein [Desulfamplus magnetovallimortis]|uniref:Addiction module antidote protein n=1 Tax=Desulfamplus magnetovallimortis TaxID=1246637 RepID=A0A1W1H9N4_9BACT|nr:hypothetical protein [Desulfamplus magnetovallimortis]SLM29181.1 conserved hypothetical protein [Desulfamplus magnetovallimortis]
MPTVDHEDTIIEMLRDDPEFLVEYIKEAFNDGDQGIFQIAIQRLIKAGNYNLDVVEKEAA